MGPKNQYVLMTMNDEGVQSVATVFAEDAWQAVDAMRALLPCETVDADDPELDTPDKVKKYGYAFMGLDEGPGEDDNYIDGDSSACATMLEILPDGKINSFGYNSFVVEPGQQFVTFRTPNVTSL